MITVLVTLECDRCGACATDERLNVLEAPDVDSVVDEADWGWTEWASTLLCDECLDPSREHAGD